MRHTRYLRAAPNPCPCLPLTANLSSVVLAHGSWLFSHNPARLRVCLIGCKKTTEVIVHLNSSAPVISSLVKDYCNVDPSPSLFRSVPLSLFVSLRSFWALTCYSIAARFTHDIIALAAFGMDMDSVRATAQQPCHTSDAITACVSTFEKLVAATPVTMWEPNVKVYGTTFPRLLTSRGF